MAYRMTALEFKRRDYTHSTRKNKNMLCVESSLHGRKMQDEFRTPTQRELEYLRELPVVKSILTMPGGGCPHIFFTAQFRVYAVRAFRRGVNYRSIFESVGIDAQILGRGKARDIIYRWAKEYQHDKYKRLKLQAELEQVEELKKQLIITQDQDKNKHQTKVLKETAE